MPTWRQTLSFSCLLHCALQSSPSVYSTVLTWIFTHAERLIDPSSCSPVVVPLKVTDQSAYQPCHSPAVPVSNAPSAWQKLGLKIASTLVVKSHLKLAAFPSYISQISKEDGWRKEEISPCSYCVFHAQSWPRIQQPPLAPTPHHAATCNCPSSNLKQPNGISESHSHDERERWGLGLFLSFVDFVFSLSFHLFHERGNITEYFMEYFKTVRVQGAVRTRGCEKLHWSIKIFRHSIENPASASEGIMNWQDGDLVRLH